MAINQIFSKISDIIETHFESKLDQFVKRTLMKNTKRVLAIALLIKLFIKRKRKKFKKIIPTPSFEINFGLCTLNYGFMSRCLNQFIKQSSKETTGKSHEFLYGIFDAMWRKCFSLLLLSIMMLENAFLS